MALNKKNFSNIKYSEVNIRCFLSARIREVFTLHNLAHAAIDNETKFL